MKFDAKADEHAVLMDAKPPIGENAGFAPKQLLLAAISGCTAMDVAALLKKYKQPLESFQVEADADSTEGSHPIVFKEIRLTYRLAGQLDSAKVLEAVTLSQTKYCGVSAMVSKAVPISYSVEVNGQGVGTGHSEFKW